MFKSRVIIKIHAAQTIERIHVPVHVMMSPMSISIGEQYGNLVAPTHVTYSTLYTHTYFQ